MSNISDKDLDKLFKEAAEGYQTSFDESAWEDMERRMDDGDDDGFSYFKILGGIIGILLLGSVVVWKISSTNQSTVTDTESSQVIAQLERIENPASTSTGAEMTFTESGQNETDKSGKVKEIRKSSDTGSDDAVYNHGEKNEFPLLNEKQSPVRERVLNTKPKDSRAINRGKDEDSNDGDIEISDRRINKGALTNTGMGLPDKIEVKQRESIENEDSDVKESTSEVIKNDYVRDTKGVRGFPAGITNDRVAGQFNEDKDKVDSNNEIAILNADTDDIHVSGDKDENIYFNKNEVLVDGDNFKKKDKEDEDLMSVFVEEESTDDSSKDNKQVGVYSPAFLKGMSYLDYEYPNAFNMRELSMVEEDQNNKEKSRRSKRRSYAVEIAYSPDLTSVGYFRPDRPGSNFGLMGAYFINRWSISTGAIYSRKIYFSEESSGGGYYSGPSDFTRIDGDCRVIDIPLNISYYLSNNANHGFYLSSGFSSYIMLKENYDFLTRSNGTEREWSQEYENKNNHFFSVLNLSIGYERRLKDGLFIQLEPFVKAPVAGIGEGKVDLVSTGAFLNLMYKFNHKNK